MRVKDTARKQSGGVTREKTWESEEGERILIPKFPTRVEWMTAMLILITLSWRY